MREGEQSIQTGKAQRKNSKKKFQIYFEGNLSRINDNSFWMIKL